ncbi:MAG TPA: hypothetical protein VJ850_12905 [Candidatus Limnocylindrales bacterium]|nr:hypothetical protein [Candidatus Limnocylindrales bacterium]
MDEAATAHAAAIDAALAPGAAPSEDDVAFATRQQLLMLGGLLVFALLLFALAGTAFAGGGGCGGG